MIPRLSSLGEDALIERLARRLGDVAPPPPVGIGDDGARLVPRAGHDLVWSTDLLVEEVHFRRRTAPPRELGRKALAVSFSDLAAMGAVPRAFLLSLALPASLTTAWIDRFADGLAAAARAAGATCAGGDTSASAGGIQISVTAAGDVRRGRLLRRDTGRPGDGLWVWGRLGASAAGLQLLRGRARQRRPAWQRRAISAHLDPRPPLALGPWLARRRTARAALDLSDGLSTDLARLCRASRVGAIVWLERLPVDRDAARLAASRGEDASELALHGGEDYGLLFAVSRRKEADLRYLPSSLAAGITRIGRLTEASAGLRVLAPDGRERPLRARGYRHFGRR